MFYGSEDSLCSVWHFPPLCYLNVICKNLLVISFARYIVLKHTKSLQACLSLYLHDRKAGGVSSGTET